MRGSYLDGYGSIYGYVGRPMIQNEVLRYAIMGGMIGYVIGTISFILILPIMRDMWIRKSREADE